MEAFYVSHSHESAVVDPTAKDTSFPSTVSSSMDCGDHFHMVPGDRMDQIYPRGLLQQHRPRTPGQSLETIQIMDINPAFSSSVNHGH